MILTKSLVNGKLNDRGTKIMEHPVNLIINLKMHLFLSAEAEKVIISFEHALST